MFYPLFLVLLKEPHIHNILLTESVISLWQEKIKTNSLGTYGLNRPLHQEVYFYANIG